MTRIILPNRRQGLSFDFSHGRMNYSGTASFGPDYEIAEIFLSGGKVGSELEAATRDCAVIASLAIQHGTPVEVIRKALTRLDDGSAAGPMGAFLDLIHANLSQ